MASTISKRAQSFFGWWTVERMGITLATFGLVVTVLGHIDDNVRLFNLVELFRDVWANLGTELFSIALTVLIIDSLNQRRERQQRQQREQARTAEQQKSAKQQLIRQLASGVNSQAMMAAEELRAQGWLQDGSVQWAKLSGANLANADLRYARLEGVRLYRTNLQQANLYKADLKNARLLGADLRGASMGGADLQDAVLSGAKLQGAYLAGIDLNGADLHKVNLEGVRKFKESNLAGALRMAGATMPDGSHYDGRYNLPGDIKLADRDGVDTDDPQAMKEWYHRMRRRGSDEPQAEDDDE